MSGGKPDEAVAGPSTPSTTAPTQQPVEAIEEDDEFEEFEPCQWNANEEDAEDSQQWQVRFLLSNIECLHPSF